MSNVTFFQLSKAELQELIRSTFEAELVKLNLDLPILGDESLTTSEAAKLMKISLPTLYKLIELEIIPCLQIGRTIRLSKNEILKALREKKYKRYNSLKP